MDGRTLDVRPLMNSSESAHTGDGGRPRNENAAYKTQKAGSVTADGTTTAAWWHGWQQRQQQCGGGSSGVTSG
eukprot:365384-Chlamydomonas_euryale.AAC.7